MKILLLENDYLVFDEVEHPDIDLRGGPAELLTAARMVADKLAGSATPTERAVWATAAIVTQARLGRSFELDGEAARDLAMWLQKNQVGSLVLFYTLHTLYPRAMIDISEAVLRARPEAVAVAAQAATMAPDEIRARGERRLATYPRDSVREHYFALVGQHRQLLPPGAIRTDRLHPDSLADVLRAGISDAVPAVRERAIAVAIGMDVVGVVRDEVLRCLDHEHEGVRQYAIVALGTLDDSESLARILDKLEAGTQPEMTSAIWALARRPDGLARVLTLAADARDWVRSELLYALAGVAAPMTDEQIAALTHAVTDERLSQVIERHLDRTRRGGPEYGPDGGVFVVRATGDASQAAKPE